MVGVVINSFCLRYHNILIYILVDSASEKKKTSDYTVMEVVGLGEDGNYYTLDLVRDKLNLKERGNHLFRLHRKFSPLGVGYEKYGTMADIEYMQERMDRENYRFHITPLGGQVPKNDRIKRLIPKFEEGKWYLPKRLIRKDWEGNQVDLIEQFVNDEYIPFPVALHDDMLDAKARILEEDLQAAFPEPQEEEEEDYNDYGIDSTGGY